MLGKALVALMAVISAQAGPAPPPAPSPTVLARSSTTITGQPLDVPRPAFEVVFSAVELPAGATLPMHKHPWPRYAYVERGRLRVHYEAAGLVREFGPGEVVIEAVDQWHEAEVVGDETVRIVVIDHVPPGESNVLPR
jgi:quercetin dioxygenase-like cupin family protein